MLKLIYSYIRHNLWNLIRPLVRWVGDKLCFLGKQVDNPIGLLMFTVIGICLSGPLSSLEPKSMNAPMIYMPKDLSRLDRKLDDFPVVSPSPAVEWSSDSTDSEGLNGSVNEPSDTCLDLRSVTEALLSTKESLCKHTSQYENNSDGKQSDDLLDNRLSSSSRQTELKDEFQQLSEKQAGGIIRRFKNRLKSWYSNIKNHLSNAASCDILEKIHQLAMVNNVFSLKYNFLGLLSLLLLFADGMFGFMRRPYIGIGVSIVIGLGISVPGILTRAPSPFLFQSDFVTLIYGIARSILYLSLILKQTQREWLSDLMAGLAYAWLPFGILCYSVSSLLPLNYACAVVSALFFFVLYTSSYGLI